MVVQCGWEWFDAILRHGVVRIDAGWDVCCGIVRYVYLNVVCIAWCEVECGRDVEWCAEMWWPERFDLNYYGPM